MPPSSQTLAAGATRKPWRRTRDAGRRRTRRPLAAANVRQNHGTNTAAGGWGQRGTRRVPQPCANPAPNLRQSRWPPPGRQSGPGRAVAPADCPTGRAARAVDGAPRSRLAAGVRPKHGQTTAARGRRGGAGSPHPKPRPPGRGTAAAGSGGGPHADQRAAVRRRAGRTRPANWRGRGRSASIPGRATERARRGRRPRCGRQLAGWGTAGAAGGDRVERAGGAARPHQTTPKPPPIPRRDMPDAVTPTPPGSRGHAGAGAAPALCRKTCPAEQVVRL
jgi:hypothetical protein